MDKEQFEKILADHELFLKSKGKNGNKADLCGKDLTGLTFKDRDLQNAELDHTILIDADLSGVNLNSASLTNSDLSGANLSGATLISADFTDSNLERSNLKNTILRGSVLSSSRLNNADLSGSDLTHANLNCADLVSAKLDKVNLSNADLRTSDLNGCSLIGADMQNAELTDAVLKNSDMQSSDLKNCDLSGADLRHTNLSHANLGNSNLNKADMSFTNLSNADLSNADLSGARLLSAVLNNTNLDFVTMDSSTIFGSTLMADTDLSSIQNLNSATHIAPSTIGIDVIVKSGGKISRTFLTGAGIPIKVSELFNSYIYTPIHSSSYYISYSDVDSEFASKVKQDLGASNIRCWSVTEEFKTGDEQSQLLQQNIKKSKGLILVLSEKSINSRWIEEELGSAIEIGEKKASQFLFPIRVDDSLYLEDAEWIEKIRGKIEIGNFNNWKDEDDYKMSLGTLLKDILQSGSKK